MECRCYRGDVGRTRLRVLRMQRLDYVTLAVCLLLFAAAIVTNYTVSFGVIVP